MAVKDERWVVIEAESLSGVLPETKYFDSAQGARDYALVRIGLGYFGRIDIAQVKARLRKTCVWQTSEESEE